MRFSPLIKDPTNLLEYEAIMYTMTTCHSLKLVSDEIIGDPLDAKMFEFTRWTFEEGGRVYEFVGDNKEDEDTGLLPKDDVIKGHYVAHDGSETGERPVVRPPASTGKVST